MQEKEIISKLEEFNKFAIELFDLNFVKKLPRSGYTIHWKKGEGFSGNLRGPNDEEIKAFVNDIRRFFQKGRIKETLKIHRLIPLYQSWLIEDSEKKIFNRAISDLDRFNKNVNNHIYNGENLTNERIFEVFLYGRYSHRTEGTKDEYDKWERFFPMHLSLKNEFIRILAEYLRIIHNVVYANNLILKRLNENETKAKRN